MVTITQDKTMPKRVTVYEKDLKPYIELVSNELANNSISLQNFADELDPPYPLMTVFDSKSKYHLSSLGLILHSCLKKLVKDLKHDSLQVNVDNCVVEYLALPSKNSGLYGDAQKGIVDTTFTDEMLELSNEVADWFVANDIKVPYLKRADVTSDKITGSLAIIYTGRVLQKRKDNVIEPSQPDAN